MCFFTVSNMEEGSVGHPPKRSAHNRARASRKKERDARDETMNPQVSMLKTSRQLFTTKVRSRTSNSHIVSVNNV